jgi:CubicO group peptidase (beta-lactamase class C family)
MIRARIGRAVLLAISAGLPLLAQGAARPQSAAGNVPVTGTPVPALASFDRTVLGLMAKWKIPGGSVAVVKDGRLVLAHGYGWADRENRQPVEPDSLFRIASLSKSLTSAAILKLMEEGRLRLDDKAFDLLGDLKPRPGATINPDLRKITIRNLLQHSGGWDRDQSFDPMFRSHDIAAAMGVPPPADAVTIHHPLHARLAGPRPVQGKGVMKGRCPDLMSPMRSALRISTVDLPATPYTLDAGRDEGARLTPKGV